MAPLPPQPSPEPPRHDGEDSGLHPALVRDVREAEVKTTKLVTSGDVKWFVGTMVAVAIGAVSIAFTLDARADGKAEKAEQHAAEALSAHERYEMVRLADIKETVGDMKAGLARQEKKTDKFLAAFNIPNPAPAPQDGGR